ACPVRELGFTGRTPVHPGWGVTTLLGNHHLRTEHRCRPEHHHRADQKNARQVLHHLSLSGRSSFRGDSWPPPSESIFVRADHLRISTIGFRQDISGMNRRAHPPCWSPSKNAGRINSLFLPAEHHDRLTIAHLPPADHLRADLRLITAPPDLEDRLLESSIFDRASSSGGAPLAPADTPSSFADPIIARSADPPHRPPPWPSCCFVASLREEKEAEGR
ncbi:hypothetical protein Dimus_036112, partial [Dionaea muscipula]